MVEGEGGMKGGGLLRLVPEHGKGGGEEVGGVP